MSRIQIEAVRKLPWAAIVGLLVLLPGAAAPAAAQGRAEVAPGITVSYPEGWKEPERRYKNAVELVRPRAQGGNGFDAHVLITTELRLSHEEAVRRLEEIASEVTERPRWMEIQGWPALIRRRTEPIAQRGEEQEEREKTSGPTGPSLRVTVAVAAGERLVRLEGEVSPDARKLWDRWGGEIEEMGRGLALPQGDPGQARRDLERLESSQPATPPPAGGTEPAKDRRRPGPATDPGKPGTGAAALVQSGVGELEVAVSNDGQVVVVAANSGYSNSTNAGASFTFRGGTPNFFPRDGDPSLAVGQSGAFYYGFIGFPNGTAGAGGVTGCSNSLGASTDSGVTFLFRGHAVLCPQTGAGLCFPDQEHIAADRVNAPTGDQVYNVWRNFTPAGSPPSCSQIGSGFVTPSIVCSSNGGTTWSAPLAVAAGGDFPRIAVASDGFVYVVYRSGGNVMLHKYSSCSSGLVAQAGFPVTVGAFTAVVCPVAGLDRCNDGNILSSPTVAVDDLDPSHIFVAYASSSGAGNENILVRDSANGGLNWSAPVTVNTAVTARRFMPWACAVGGRAWVTWYDRRTATAANNDLTGYRAASAAVRGGTLQAGPEIDIAGVSDPQCASGWPCAPRAMGDSESCSVQPELAGVCSVSVGIRCDFSSGGCPAGESCLAGGGCPKYGDYNGTACMAGSLYAAWASATTPAGAPAGAGIRVFESTVPLPSDFFVRDWTTNAASHDTGPEPSTNPVFYATSDVWSRSSNAPGAFVGDQPQSHDAHSGAGAAGDNFAFVRVSRRSPAAATAPAVPVTVHFMYADFGLGSPFVDAGSPPPLNFTAADNSLVLPSGHSWHLGPGTSTHVCLAVEISTPADPLTLPSLQGSTAGWPTDLQVLGDNNKAQRNLWVNAVPGEASGGAAAFALIHNAAPFQRDLILQVQAAPGVLRKLPGVRAAIVGGEAVLLRAENRLVLSKMQPGENRWISLQPAKVQGREGELLPVTFQEVVDGKVVNGFTIAAQRAPLGDVLRRNVIAHREVFARLSAAFGIPEGDREANRAARLLRGGQVPAEAGYRNLLSQGTLAPLVKALLTATRGDDPLGAGPAAAALQRAAAARGRLADLAVAHTDLLNRLDALETRLQKAQGDPAAILETVRWQKALFEKLSKLEPSAEIAKRSAEYIRACEQKQTGNEQYPDLVRALLPGFTATARILPNSALSRRIAALEAAPKSLAALQKAHRELLLALQAAAGSR